MKPIWIGLKNGSIVMSEEMEEPQARMQIQDACPAR
jgi:hypothetical protein